MEPKCRVWVVFGEKMKLGDGRAHLLELIDELGSLRQAVARIGMSYRNAWGYLRDLEKAAGFKLLERRPGGGPGAGTRLTAEGRRFLERYQRFKTEIMQAADRRFHAIFAAQRNEQR